MGTRRWRMGAAAVLVCAALAHTGSCLQFEVTKNLPEAGYDKSSPGETIVEERLHNPNRNNKKYADLINNQQEIRYEKSSPGEMIVEERLHNPNRNHKYIDGIKNQPEIRYEKSSPGEMIVQERLHNPDRNNEYLDPEFRYEKSSPGEMIVQERLHNPGRNKNNKPVFTDIGLQGTADTDSSPESRVIVKREAKKPKNTKRRKKFSKKKMMLQQQHESESEKDSKKSKSKSKSESEESEDSETAPESEDDSDSDATYNSSDIDSDDYEESEEESSDESDSDDKTKESKEKKSRSDSDVTTEEVSLTSEEEESEEIYSGPDSSPPASSDSTDESSASKAISGGSSEVSYTMSSSAEDAFPKFSSEFDSEESKEKKGGISYTLSSSASVYSSSEDSSDDEDSDSEESEKETREDSSKASSKSKEKSKTTSKEKSKPTSKSVSKEKSKAVSKSEENEPKVTSKIKKRKGKKITEINIKLDKVKGVSKSLNTAKKDGKMADTVSEGMKLDNKVSDNKQEVKLEESKNKLKLESVEKDSQHVGLTAARVLNMVENAVHTHQGLSNDEKHPSAGKPDDRKTPSALSASKERPVMEMMKVKKAEDDPKKKAEVDPKKKAELENELLKDYPVDGSVEITNWQGTFAPIAGEPYVAPVQHQPDSFWDAIYRSTSPDLPTPPGGGYTGDSEVTPAPDSVEPTVHQTLGRFAQPKQEVYHTEYERTKYVEGKTKDKAKKEPKKPKLSPKEKKQKKREKKEKKEGKIGQGDIKVNAYHDGDQKMISADAHQRLQDEILMHPNINPVASVNQPSPHNAHGHGVIHAAGKSEETLKTPSEEERESGTTYRPEGNYEYPSFRHPDFNPDTAYDENGIPIHESPGWTPPPTLPGDNRFGKDRSRAAVPRDQAHGSLTLARPQTAGNHVVANKAVKPLADPHVAQPVHPDPHLQHALHPNIAAHETDKAGKPLTDPHVAQPLHPDPHLQHALHPNMAAHEEPHLQHPLHPNVAAHEANKAVKPLTASHVAQPLHPEHHFQQALHANLAAHENLQHPLNLHSNLADQEHQHLAEALHAAHMDPAAAAHSEHDDHPGVPHILPALHQGAPIKDGAVNHKIQKRMAEEPGETLDSLSSVMTTRELNTAAERYNQQSKANQYKAYKLTDSELKEKDDSAPLEALNPALYMHRNIFHVKKKPQKNHIPELGGSEEVIALVVGPKNVDPKEALKMIGLNKFHKVRKVQPKKPVVYTKKNEAQNPLLYKHRNMLKVSDIKDDEMKIHKNMAKQMALQELQKKAQTKVLPLEDILGAHGFKGRGRENFNTIFVNRHKLFQVNTNKFKQTSMEHIVAKREVKESLNPILYSYQNLFGSNPKQILPLKNEKMKETPDQGASSPVSRFAMVQGQNTIDPAKVKGPMFGGGVPIIDQDSIEKPLDPKVKQYVGRKKEAMNPYLMNFPNMFAINPKAPPKQQGLKDKPNTALNPSVKQYMGRNKENLNPFLYGYSNMFGANNNGPDKVQLQAGDINPMLYAKQKPCSAVEKESVMSKYRNIFANPAPRLNSANDQQANDNSRINERARPRRHIAEMGHNLLKTFDRRKRETKDQHSKEAVRPRPDEQRKAKLKKEIEKTGGTPGAGRPKNLRRKTKDDDDSFASYFEGVDPNVVESEESTPHPEITTNVNSTRINHDHPRNRKQRKLAVHKQKVIQANARIFHRLTKEMRPLWRQDLRDLNLNPDNTTVEFTDSMQEEIADAIEQKLLNGPPKEDTIDELVQELYKMVESRQKLNKPVGHIILGLEPIRDPLVRGTIHVRPSSERGEYHLRYWPLDEPGEPPRVLSGTVNLKHLRGNLTHKHAAHEILQSILTVKPHELSHSKADEVLNKIFTKPTSKLQEPTRDVTSSTTEPSIVKLTITKSSITTKRLATKREEKIVEDSKIAIKEKGNLDDYRTVEKETLEHSTLRKTTVEKSTVTEHEAEPVVTEAPKPAVQWESEPQDKKVSKPTVIWETEPILKEKPFVREEKKPVVKEKLSTTLKWETKPIAKEETKPTTIWETEPVLKERPTTAVRSETTAYRAVREGTRLFTKELMSTQSPMTKEYSKLRETITKSRNISSILMEEMEARERKKSVDSMEDVLKMKFEGKEPFGNWKLQQRIREFRPERPFPTMPPFVRRWPTFRPQPRVNLTAAPTPRSITVVPTPVSEQPTTRPTMLTMRPKYGGPRHKPAFFFNDFQRIRTVYPTKSVAVTESWKRTDKIKDLERTGVFEQALTTSISKTDFDNMKDDVKGVLESIELLEDRQLHHTSTTKPIHRRPTSFDDTNRVAENVEEEQHEMYMSRSSHKQHQEPVADDYSFFKDFEYTTTIKPRFVEVKIDGKVHTAEPIIIRRKKRTTTSTPLIHLTTPRTSHFHKIKHHVKTGFEKLFSFFGFGKSKSKTDKE